MKSKILNLLRQNRGGYVSGQELCQQFGVTRTAVWKGINQLKEEGYIIEAVPKKGYCLVSSPDSIAAVELKSRMKTQWLAQELYSLEEIDSTNNYVKKLAEDGAKHGTLVVADYQSGGKGRRGRAWVTPKGTAIAMSFLLRPQLEPNRASMLTLVAGLAITAAIREVTGLDAKIKWPNDVVIGGRKLTGILTEMSIELQYINYVVIGIGINANVETFPEELQDTATSLKLATGQQVDRAEIICASMRYFEEYYEMFMEHGDMTSLKEAYEEVLANINMGVRVLEPNHEYEGIARGIDAQGQLLVEKEDGSITAVYAGEVSVRGIYGYV